MTLTLMSDVKPERVRWLWPGRIPFGKLTILDGDPGLGKSTLMLDIAARLSVGAELPGGGRHPPMGTVIMMVEDGLADTVAPRLLNAGADMTRIGAIELIIDAEGNDRLPSIPDNIPDIENVLPAVEAGLIVIDPIMSYLGEKTSSKDDQSTRRALTPLAAFAERTGVAIVMLRHFNKGSNANVLYRGQNSIAFIAICRSGLVVARDPDDPTRSVLASSKSNLGPTPPTLTYRLENCPNDAARVGWEGVSAHTAQTIVDQPQDEEGRGAVDEACDFLQEALAGGPVLTRTLQHLARDAGVAWDTVRRAQRRMRIVPRKAKTQDGQWTWAMPEVVAPSPAPTFNNNNNNNIFEGYREDVELVEGDEDGHVVETPPGTNNFAGNVPIALVGGKAKCVECQKTIIRMAGQALICKECLGSKSAALAD